MNKIIKKMKIPGGSITDFVMMFVTLFVFWIILSERFESKFILFGLGTSIVVVTMTIESMTLIGYKSGKKYNIFHVNAFKFIVYIIWLLREIVISSMGVALVILKPSLVIQAQIVHFKADYDNPSARALLANSITLTPGTVTIDIFENGVYRVHCLTIKSRDDLLQGQMQGKIAKLFNEDINYYVLNKEEVEELKNDN